MKYKLNKSVLIICFALLVIGQGCATTHDHLLGSEEQLKLRSMQTRAFDTTDREKTLRTVIATMQDLGFIIDKADALLGTVSATKLDGYNLRLTVSVRPRGDSQLLVRANAQYNIKAVVAPKPYQDFFNALSKAMFLTANNVD